MKRHHKIRNKPRMKVTVDSVTGDVTFSYKITFGIWVKPVQYNRENTGVLAYTCK